MKCENTQAAIQQITVKYYGFFSVKAWVEYEQVWRGCQLSHAALIMTRPQMRASRAISPGSPFIGC